MNVSINFTIPDPAQLLVYILIGIVVAALIFGLGRLHSAVGFVVTAVLAGVGAWVFANVLQLTVFNDVVIARVPLIEALIGALLFGLVGGLAFARRRRVVLDD